MKSPHRRQNTETRNRRNCSPTARDVTRRRRRPSTCSLTSICRPFPSPPPPPLLSSPKKCYTDTISRVLRVTIREFAHLFVNLFSQLSRVLAVVSRHAMFVDSSDVIDAEHCQNTVEVAARFRLLRVDQRVPCAGGKWRESEFATRVPGLMFAVVFTHT